MVVRGRPIARARSVVRVPVRPSATECDTASPRVCMREVKGIC